MPHTAAPWCQECWHTPKPAHTASGPSWGSCLPLKKLPVGQEIVGQVGAEVGGGGWGGDPFGAGSFEASRTVWEGEDSDLQGANS